MLTDIIPMTTAHTTTLLADGRWEGGPGPWWPIFPLTWLLVVAAIITTIVVVGRRRSRREGSRAGRNRLAERFASGEIDEQEYEQRLATINRLEK
jgi:putative membrane protein